MSLIDYLGRNQRQWTWRCNIYRVDEMQRLFWCNMHTYRHALHQALIYVFGEMFPFHALQGTPYWGLTDFTLDDYRIEIYYWTDPTTTAEQIELESGIEMDFIATDAHRKRFLPYGTIHSKNVAVAAFNISNWSWKAMDFHLQSLAECGALPGDVADHLKSDHQKCASHWYRIHDLQTGFKWIASRDLLIWTERSQVELSVLRLLLEESLSYNGLTGSALACYNGSGSPGHAQRRHEVLKGRGGIIMKEKKRQEAVKTVQGGECQHVVTTPAVKGWHICDLCGKKLRPKDVPAAVEKAEKAIDDTKTPEVGPELPVIQTKTIEHVGKDTIVKENGTTTVMHRDGVGEYDDYVKPEIATKKAKTVTIICIDCGDERVIKPQDAFQVKRCVACQKIHRSSARKNRVYSQEKAKEDTSPAPEPKNTTPVDKTTSKAKKDASKAKKK